MLDITLSNINIYLTRKWYTINIYVCLFIDKHAFIYCIRLVTYIGNVEIYTNLNHINLDVDKA